MVNSDFSKYRKTKTIKKLRVGLHYDKKINFCRGFHILYINRLIYQYTPSDINTGSPNFKTELNIIDMFHGESE